MIFLGVGSFISKTTFGCWMGEEKNLAGHVLRASATDKYQRKEEGTTEMAPGKEKSN